MSPRTAMSDVSEMSQAVSQLTAELALLQVKQESTSRSIQELEIRLNESQGNGDAARAEINSLRVVEEGLKHQQGVCLMNLNFMRFAEQQLEQARQRAEQEAQRANLEAQRAAQETQRANLEAQRAEQEAQRANLEAQRAEQLQHFVSQDSWNPVLNSQNPSPGVGGFNSQDSLARVCPAPRPSEV